MKYNEGRLHHPTPIVTACAADMQASRTSTGVFSRCYQCQCAVSVVLLESYGPRKPVTSSIVTASRNLAWIYPVRLVFYLLPNNFGLLTQDTLRKNPMRNPLVITSRLESVCVILSLLHTRAKDIISDKDHAPMGNPTSISYLVYP